MAQEDGQPQRRATQTDLTKFRKEARLHAIDEIRTA
jgi:hypothetical protein